MFELKCNSILLEFKQDAIDYCTLDCVSLYQILYKFSSLIFDLFSINIKKYPTLASLAFAIFRSNFMSEENIPRLSRKHVDNIRSGYTGGAVDMYIPISKKNEVVYHYDVNSLYPSSMLKQMMPIGKVKFFTGDIFKFNPDAFGFFFCKIEAPDKIKHPIVQTHVKTESGIRTMSPIGTWTDYIFSVELKNAEKYGYKFQILEGYLFERENIFKDYVTTLFGIRMQYPKSDPMNFIAKLLLNSLYGRFGMDDDYPNIDIIPNEYYQDFFNKNSDNILVEKILDNHKLIIHSNPNLSDSSGNVSVGVAAAITAYSRIHMTEFKNTSDFKLFYTDTDSVFTNKPLPDYLIGKDIGKMKLEGICKKTIFLGPKVYCLLMKNGIIISKVKGLKHDIAKNLTMSDFEKLLFKDSEFSKSQIKWKRNLEQGKITLIDELYTLKVNDNKRQLIYNKKGKLIGTKEYVISDSKEIRK